MTYRASVSLSRGTLIFIQLTETLCSALCAAGSFNYRCPPAIPILMCRQCSILPSPPPTPLWFSQVLGWHIALSSRDEWMQCICDCCQTDNAAAHWLPAQQVFYYNFALEMFFIHSQALCICWKCISSGEHYAQIEAFNIWKNYSVYFVVKYLHGLAFEACPLLFLGHNY